MPLSFDTIFKAFKENVTATVMSLLVIGISVLFVINQKGDASIKDDLRKSNKDCATEKYVVQMQMERLNDKYIEIFGLYKEFKTEIETLKKMGAIK